MKGAAWAAATYSGRRSIGNLVPSFEHRPCQAPRSAAAHVLRPPTARRRKLFVPGRGARTTFARLALVGDPRVHTFTGVKHASVPRLTNDELADALDEVAFRLDVQEADPHRVRAWRDAARVVRDHPESVCDLAHDRGPTALDALPHIGPRIASALDELSTSGRLRMLDRLRGELSPEDLFTRVPGVGPTLAARIHGELGVETLEELELAAHDGRLKKVQGLGPRRLEVVKDVLAAMLGSARRRPTPQKRRARPALDLLLEVDAEYRRRAADGTLRRIAPRRFNPRHEAWLPILHVHRDGWDVTALFSNTAQAHALGRTHDWVVLYYDRDGDEGQCTVVTERSGPLAGLRVVRGRERELAAPAAELHAAV
jgi:hypothetical protein